MASGTWSSILVWRPPEPPLPEMMLCAQGTEVSLAGGGMGAESQQVTKVSGWEEPREGAAREGMEKA